MLPISGNIEENVTIENKMSGAVADDNMLVAEQQQKEQVLASDANAMVTMETGIEDEICSIFLFKEKIY